jgi:hypothetical protein
MKMSGLYLELTPAYLFTQNGEPANIPIRNKMVIALHNPFLEESVTLKNDAQTEYTDLPSYDNASVMEGLTCIYLRFDLGTSPGCLTDEESFANTLFACPDDWYFCKKDLNTIILYPSRTISLEPSSCIEFLLDRLCTSLPKDTSTSCCIKYVNVAEGSIQEGTFTLYKKRVPLNIRHFAPAAEDVVTGFRDTVRLEWCVTGADKVILQPGGLALDKAGSCQITITARAAYTLTAYCGNRQVSQSIFLEPLTASIESFSLTPSASGQEITLSWKAANTRHVFLSRIGRIDADTGSLTLKRDANVRIYTLTVENQDGLLTCSRQEG